MHAHNCLKNYTYMIVFVRETRIAVREWACCILWKIYILATMLKKSITTSLSKPKIIFSIFIVKLLFLFSH